MASTVAVNGKHSPFHFGEQSVQKRLGVYEVADRIGRAFLRPYLTEQAKDYFEDLSLLYIGARYCSPKQAACTCYVLADSTRDVEIRFFLPLPRDFHTNVSCSLFYVRFKAA